MTLQQKDNYNKMLFTLRKITKFNSVDKLHKNSIKQYGLNADEAIEMAYENTQQSAKECIKGLKILNK